MEENIKQNIKPREIVEEMQQAYLEYAMSVIVARALPDVRDGLKPVHRRILYSMHEMGLRPGAKYQKSAKVVGYVLGQYHPHGDTAAYDSMVRMAQDFSLRYPLVDGQGNFGCFTKDTEVKLTDGRDLSFGELPEGLPHGVQHGGHPRQPAGDGEEAGSVGQRWPPRILLGADQGARGLTETRHPNCIPGGTRGIINVILRIQHRGIIFHFQKITHFFRFLLGVI